MSQSDRAFLSGVDTDSGGTSENESGTRSTYYRDGDAEEKYIQRARRQSQRTSGREEPKGKPNSRNFVEDLMHFMLSAIFNIAKKVVEHMIPLIALVIAISVSFWVASSTVSYLGDRLRSELCALPLPLIGGTSMCSSMAGPATTVDETRYQDFVNLQLKIEPVVETIGYGSRLAGDMKQAQTVVGNLIPAVEYSQLARKDDLVAALKDFAKLAGDASFKLSRLDSAVGGTISTMIANDGYAVKALDEIIAVEQSQSFWSLLTGTTKSTKQARTQLVKMYNWSIRMFQQDLDNLIRLTEATMDVLNRLEYKVQDIRNVVDGEHMSLPAVNDNILAALWSHVVRNNVEYSNNVKKFRVIEKVGEWRKQAIDQVQSNLIHLQQMDSDLSDLNVRSDRYFIRNEAEDPLEVSMEALRAGVERLNKGRVRAEQRHDAVIEQKFNGGPLYAGIGQR